MEYTHSHREPMFCFNRWVQTQSFYIASQDKRQAWSWKWPSRQLAQRILSVWSDAGGFMWKVQKVLIRHAQGNRIRLFVENEKNCKSGHKQLEWYKLLLFILFPVVQLGGTQSINRPVNQRQSHRLMWESIFQEVNAVCPQSNEGASVWLRMTANVGAC